MRLAQWLERTISSAIRLGPSFRSRHGRDDRRTQRPSRTPAGCASKGAPIAAMVSHASIRFSRLQGAGRARRYSCGLARPVSHCRSTWLFYDLTSTYFEGPGTADARGERPQPRRQAAQPAGAGRPGHGSTAGRSRIMSSLAIGRRRQHRSRCPARPSRQRFGLKRVGVRRWTAAMGDEPETSKSCAGRRPRLTSSAATEGAAAKCSTTSRAQPGRGSNVEAGITHARGARETRQKTFVQDGGRKPARPCAVFVVHSAGTRGLREQRSAPRRWSACASSSKPCNARVPPPGQGPAQGRRPRSAPPRARNPRRQSRSSLLRLGL